MIYTTITPEEFSDWVNLCGGGFEMVPDEFYDHFVNDPDADYNGVFVAIDDSVAHGGGECVSFCSAERGNMAPLRGRMVSSVRIFTRTMYLGGCEIRCGAVGEVCTLREYRGRGLSGKLLTMAIEYMKNSGFSVSQLFTGVNDHYARYGWFTVPLQYADVRLSGDAARDVTLRCAEERDVPALCRLHDRFARSLDGVFVRRNYGRQYWIDWMVRNPGHRLAACYGDEVVAYADFHVDDGRLKFREFLGEDELMLPLFVRIASEYAFGADVLFDVPRPIADRLSLSVVGTHERRDCMYRLNSAFEVGGKVVDCDAALRSLLCSAATFEADNY